MEKNLKGVGEVGESLEVGCEADGCLDLTAREVVFEEVREEEVGRGLDFVRCEGEGLTDREFGFDSDDNSLVHQDG